MATASGIRFGDSIVEEIAIFIPSDAPFVKSTVLAACNPRWMLHVH